MFLAELSPYMLRFNLISLPHTMIITYFSVSKRARNFEKQPPTPHYSHLSPTHSEYSSPCVLGYSGQTSELLWSQITSRIREEKCKYLILLEEELATSTYWPSLKEGELVCSPLSPHPSLLLLCPPSPPPFCLIGTTTYPTKTI